MTRLKNRILALIVLCLFLFSSAIPQSTNKKADRNRSVLKTALIYNFTKYVYWPGEDRMSQFVICVISSESMTNQLKGLESAAKFRNRIPIKVIFCKSINDIQPCQMLIVDGEKTENLWSVYSKIRGKSVLMVAENLLDYKKSMISFIEVSNKYRFIINKTKLEESKLVVNELLYANAIVKEGEWKSIFDKFKSLIASGDKQVSLDRDDLKQFMSQYKNLEEEKKDKENMITKIADSLNSITLALESQKKEAEEIAERIEKQKAQKDSLDKEISGAKRDIVEQKKIVSSQKTIISIIALLSAIGIILLLFTIRSNNQRRKANKLLSEQKTEIERQKHLVDEKQKEILDSINYAKRIQTALMASNKLLNDHLPEHFVLFKPKDIVAGDFYWASAVDGCFTYITADSTGHGVPGAFMSLLNISKLTETINQKKILRPDLVLNDVKTGIIKALNPEGSSEESKDGMDAILCKLDRKNMKLEFAAANNSSCLVRNGEIIILKADKMPVGKSHDDGGTFTYNEIGLQRGDMIYTFTDGYGDQFGGPEGKKFKHKQLREIFLEVSSLPISQQKEVVNRRFEEWKGHLEQVDDVLVIGVRV
jgi:serine phosphatase RsbU (regulator of sigma subunit)